MAGLCEGGNEPSGSLKTISISLQTLSRVFPSLYDSTLDQTMVGHPASASDRARFRSSILINARGPESQALPDQPTLKCAILPQLLIDPGPVRIRVGYSVSSHCKLLLHSNIPNINGGGGGGGGGDGGGGGGGSGGGGGDRERIFMY
ncbi:hypothetical protein ANN_01154 [Periplaneta americana]|uniref:Uncharacterized protein n=1 Tax=Periplaneta americana TaxID=6978 RepID=A0ABQ8TVU3_PERAM|nr:hypothetical protein ANN_01154 [Periplaneta americana]